MRIIGRKKVRMQDQKIELENIHKTLDADRARYINEKNADELKFHSELEKVNRGETDNIDLIRRVDACKGQKKKLDIQIDRLNEKYEELLRREKTID